MSTQTFDETQHPRETTGKFATKTTAEADGGLGALATHDGVDRLARLIATRPDPDVEAIADEVAQLRAQRLVRGRDERAESAIAGAEEVLHEADRTAVERAARALANEHDDDPRTAHERADAEKHAYEVSAHLRTLSLTHTAHPYPQNAAAWGHGSVPYYTREGIAASSVEIAPGIDEAHTNRGARVIHLSAARNARVPDDLRAAGGYGSDDGLYVGEHCAAVDATFPREVAATHWVFEQGTGSVDDVPPERVARTYDQARAALGRESGAPR